MNDRDTVTTALRDHAPSAIEALADVMAIIGSQPRWDTDTPGVVASRLDKFALTAGLPSVSGPHTDSFWEGV